MLLLLRLLVLFVDVVLVLVLLLVGAGVVVLVLLSMWCCCSSSHCPTLETRIDHNLMSHARIHTRFVSSLPHTHKHTDDTTHTHTKLHGGRRKIGKRHYKNTRTHKQTHKRARARVNSPPCVNVKKASRLCAFTYGGCATLCVCCAVSYAGAVEFQRR